MTEPIRNRIKRFATVKASELIRNDRNWRLHPDSQRSALLAALDEVGYVGAVIARELPDGTLRLLDGHLRADIAEDQDVPVLVVDVTDEEEALVLSTFDPLGAMAQADMPKLRELLADVDAQQADLAAMLETLAAEVVDSEVPEGNQDIDEDEMANTKHECPKCGFKW